MSHHFNDLNMHFKKARCRLPFELSVFSQMMGPKIGRNQIGWDVWWVYMSTYNHVGMHNMSNCLSLFLFLCLSLSLCLSICLSICQTICLSRLQPIGVQPYWSSIDCVWETQHKERRGKRTKESNNEQWYNIRTHSSFWICLPECSKLHFCSYLAGAFILKRFVLGFVACLDFSLLKNEQKYVKEEENRHRFCWCWSTPTWYYKMCMKNIVLVLVDHNIKLQDMTEEIDLVLICHKHHTTNVH